MARIVLFIFFSYVAFFLMVSVSFAQSNDSLTNKSKNFIKDLEQGSYKKAYEQFDNQMRNVMDTVKLQQAWTSLHQQLGDFKEVSSTEVEDIKIYKKVHNMSKFQNGSLDIQLIFDSKGKISGLYFAPIGSQ